ncbi:ABC transporter permease [Psychromicrobium xiongbiense]|uniref:ABC transporter permease n=1 Tax=Psychromicrobium xiongbiense TaxID=3051184 RepID=UPI0025573CC9|nr:ABC transporter permease [Psychromicrobium sp. YIM S02556]
MARGRTRLPNPLTPLESAERARRFGWWYFAEQVLRQMRVYLVSVIMYSIGTPLAYLLAMGVGLATLVNASAQHQFSGVSYQVFIAPALVASTALMSAAGEFMYPVMDGFKWRRVYYGPYASPLRPEQIAQGHVVAVFLRILLPTVIYYLIVVLFGVAPSPWGWFSVLSASIAAMSFGLPLMAWTATLTKDAGQFALVQRFVVAPLFLFSGTFFPLTQLPWFLQWIGWISPLWHATELGRVFSFGYQEPLWLSLMHAAYLLVLAWLGWVLAQRMFARRLQG